MPYFFPAFRHTFLVEVNRSQKPLARSDRPAVPKAAAVLWVRARYAHLDIEGENVRDIRVIVNYSIRFL